MAERSFMNTSLYRKDGPLAGLAFILALAFLIYLPSFGGTFHYDDLANLKELGETGGRAGYLRFLFSGESGTLGRPLPLATFLLQREDWPDHPAAFLQANILIHLFNGILLFLFLRQLPWPGAESGDQTLWLALATTLLWLIHPLLMSTNLLIIQRMTSLMATMTLAGLGLFVWGRNRLRAGKSWGYGAMSVGIGLGTILAVLCKENGVLLPLYALVLEATLLGTVDREKVPGNGAWQTGYRKIMADSYALWRWVFLVSPQVLILGYVLTHLPTLLDAYAIRPFDLPTRLLTEVRALGDYLALLLLPDPTRLGGMQDDYPIIRQATPAILLLILFGVSALLAAVRFRKRQPVAAFAVLWFLAGHSLESTIFPLELYFEHRNYLPAAGPLVALTYLVLGIPWPRWLTIGLRALFLFYLLFVGQVAYSVARVWGNPRLAGQLWVEQHPHSVRAVQFLARIQLEVGDAAGALATLRAGSSRIGEDASLAMQGLILGCQLDPPVDFSLRSGELLQQLSTARYTNVTLSGLMDLATLTERGKCPGLRAEEIRAMADTLLRNPVYAAHPKTSHWLHHTLARLALREQDFGETMRHLEMAYQAMPDINTGLMLASILASGGYPERALERLNTLKKNLPGHRILQDQVRDQITRIESAIRDSNPSDGKAQQAP